MPLPLLCKLFGFALIPVPLLTLFFVVLLFPGILQSKLLLPFLNIAPTKALNMLHHMSQISRWYVHATVLATKLVSDSIVQKLSCTVPKSVRQCNNKGRGVLCATYHYMTSISFSKMLLVHYSAE